MSSLRDQKLEMLMQDFVRQHGLHVRVGDISTWERFKRKTGVQESVEALVARYAEGCVQPMDFLSENGDLREGVHYTWSNDARDEMVRKGMHVKRDMDMVRRVLALPYNNDTQSECSAGSGGTSVSLSGGEDNWQLDSWQESTAHRPRSKRTPISSRDRYLKIKRNLTMQKKRRASTGSPQY